METADDRRSVSARNPLRLDLSAVRDSSELERHDEPPSTVQLGLNASPPSSEKHGRFRDDYCATGADANVSAERSAIELWADAADSESHWAESGEPGVSHLAGNTGVAGVVTSASKHTRTLNGSNTARDISANGDNQCGSSNSGLGNTSNSTANTNRYLNPIDKTKRGTEQASPPNSSPARFEGPSKKGAFSTESRTSPHGVMPVDINGRKASSFTPSTNTLARTRGARGSVATHTTATKTGNIFPEKYNEGSFKHGGQTEKFRAAGGVSSPKTQQTEKEIAQGEDAQGEQQNVQGEEVCSQTSDDSEDDDEEGQNGSGDSDSCDAESPNTSPKEGHSEEEDEQCQDTTKAYPTVVEMDLDDADEEDILDGELRYNMRTGKFSKAYVVRGAASHRILPRRRTIVGSEKGSETSWIFPWEVRPEVDVFTAATAATAASSAKRQQLPPAGRSSSARVNALSTSHSFSPRTSVRRLANGFWRPEKPHFKHFQGRDAEADDQSDVVISERQKESVFDCLSKMAQANEWAEMMKINRNYRAFKTREGRLACHVYQEKSYLKRLPMEVFMSYEYPRLRRRYMLCCPYLHVQSQTAANTNLNDAEVRMRRELELQNVLLSTIQLTHTLREQLDIVQSASNESPRTQLR